MDKAELEGIVEHIEVVKAYLAGEKVEALYGTGTWLDVNFPLFVKGVQYRVKPQEAWTLYNIQTNRTSYAVFNNQKEAENYKFQFTDLPESWQVRQLV